MTRTVLVGSVLALLASCAQAPPPPPPEMEYLPPTAPPSQARAAYVRQTRDLVLNQLLDWLTQSPLEVEQFDDRQGIIVATYSGDPEPHVDCGWIVLYGPNQLQRIPAASRATSLARLVGGGTASVERDLKLDGRLVVQVEPQGLDTVVGAESAYVLTKTVTAADPSGRRLGGNREVVSFSSGGRGAFAKGTVCQPTGTLEQTVMSVLPSATPIAVPPRPGVAADASAVRELPVGCVGAEGPYCDLLAITAPYRQANQRENLGLSVQTLNGETTLLEGDRLDLDIGLPSFDAFVLLSYVRRDGTVGHILNGGEGAWPANAREFLYDSGFAIAEPFGLEMIFAVASEIPLFATPRPQAEPVETYLAALGDRLAEIGARDPAARIAATHLLVTTAPRAPSLSALERR